MGARLIALQEQAEELGFETIQEAIDAGYEVEYHTHGNHKLVKPKDELEKAHEAWLEEKEQLLERLEKQRDTFDKLHYVEPYELLSDTIAFIKRGEC